MPQHLIEVYSPKNGNTLAGERYVSIGMPVESTADQMEAASTAAKSSVEQMLARLGVQPELEIVYIKDAPTSEEIAAAREGVANGSIPTYTFDEAMARGGGTEA